MIIGASAAMGRRRALAAGPAWVPSDATSAVLRAWVVFDPDDVTLDGSLINAVADRSSIGNGFAALALDGTRPTFDADGMRGQPCAVFDGVDDALACAAFSWGGTAYGTVAIMVQHEAATASGTFWGQQGTRPFVLTANPGASAGFNPSGGASATTDSIYGPSVLISRWGGTGTERSLWVDGVKQGAAVDGGSPPADNLRMGIGYDAANTPARRTKCRVRAWVAYRGALSDEETLLLDAYMRSLAPIPSTGVGLWLAGQSNALATGLTSFPRLIPRRDIYAARDCQVGATRTQQAWGAMANAFGSQRGIGVEACVQLHDERAIRAHLINGAYSATGFLNSGGTPDLWIPPSSNGGTPGVMYQRLVDLINNTYSANPSTSSRVRTWLLWAHGETDATNATAAAAYGTNLENFLSDLVSDTGQSDLRVIVVQLHAGANVGNLSQRNAVRAGQAAAVAAFGANAQLLDIDALALQGDNVHYSQAAAISIASSWVNAIVADMP